MSNPLRQWLVRQKEQQHQCQSPASLAPSVEGALGAQYTVIEDQTITTMKMAMSNQNGVVWNLDVLRLQEGQGIKTRPLPNFEPQFLTACKDSFAKQENIFIHNRKVL